MFRKLTCKELVELVTEYFEGTLPRGDRRRFERHLAGCDACSIYLEQMRQTIELTGTLRTEDVSPEAEDALLEVFREWHSASA